MCLAIINTQTDAEQGGHTQFGPKITMKSIFSSEIARVTSISCAEKKLVQKRTFTSDSIATETESIKTKLNSLTLTVMSDCITYSVHGLSQDPRHLYMYKLLNIRNKNTVSQTFQENLLCGHT